MKRIFFLFSVALFAMVTFAEPVDKAEAQAAARAFLASRGVTMLSTEAPYKAPRRGRAAENPPYYVVNAGNNNGYVFVAGDDRAPAILGYVDNGSFDEKNIPENMQSYLQLLSDEIQLLEESDAEESAASSRRSVQVKYTRHSISPLVKSRWNQGSPYNDSCPDYYKEDGTAGRPASGCVATAFAQIINFYKFPDAIMANIPAHTCTYTCTVNGQTVKKTSTCKMVPKGTKIDWEHMCDTYSGKEDSVQRKAVADLLLFCGQSVKMGYGGSSGAVTAYCKDAIMNYFGFDDSAGWYGRGDYNVNQWVDLLYNELDAGYPILFSGHSTGGGHAFIIDGFDGDDLFHVNWGWGGSSDGWFIITSLNPGDNSGMGASSTADGYSMSQGVMLGARLPNNRKNEPTTKLNVTNINIQSPIVSTTFKNNTGSTGAFATALVRYDGESKSYVTVGMSRTISNLGNGSTQNVSFNLYNRLTPGTYQLCPASRLSSNKTWRLAFNMQREYIQAVVDSTGHLSLEHIQANKRALVCDTIVFPGTCVVNTSQQVMVTLRNEGDEFFDQMSLYAAAPGGTKTYQESRSQVSVPAGSSTQIVFNFKPTEVGTYDVWICSNDGNTVYGHTTVDIKRTSTQGASLYVSDVKIQNSSNGTVYGNRLQGTVSIKNQRNKEFDGKVKIQIWVQGENNSSTWWSSSSTTVPLTLGPLKTGVVKFNFQNLIYNRQYQVVAYYVGQDGTLDNGQMWNSKHYFTPKPGIIYWKENGDIACMASKPIISTPSGTSGASGLYMNGTDITRMSPNRSNPNTIYTFANNDEIPTFTNATNHVNIVKGGAADTIILKTGNSYFVPVAFRANHAVFTHTFPANTNGTFWETFSVPFDAKSLTIDSVEYQINGEDNHFWIYEFSKTYDEMPVFTPATRILSELPYIIAADSTLAGKTITFASDTVDFYRTGDVSRIVSSDYFTFNTSTIKETIRGGYHLNASGTAFDYVAGSKAVLPLMAWFTTKMPLEGDGLVAPTSIPLPEVPVPTAINQVKATPADGVQPVYNTQGQRVGETTVRSGVVSLKGLKPGIYIVGGRKVLVK